MKFSFVFILSSFLSFAGAASATDFHGYYCTQDCSGHKAGYAWAAKKQIAERENCGGKSNSFTEGCYAWVEGQDHADFDEPNDNGGVENVATPEK